MATRTVIEIDEDKCDGCGQCATGCHEGALRIIDGKARLVGESLCDGLGACIGECPRGALQTVQRDVEDYDERRVIDNILPKGMATVAAHLDHLSSHGQDTWYNQALAVLAEKGIALPSAAAPEQAADACGCGSSAARVPGPAAGARFGTLRQAPAGMPTPRIVENGMSGGCPGSAARAFGSSAGKPAPAAASSAPASGGGMASRLEQWPIQLHLANPRAPFFKGADVLIAADCTAFACGAFHQTLLAGRKLVIACPKLDTGKEIYVDKIRALIDDAGIASLTLAIMEVPCCSGLKRLVDEAAAGASRSVPTSTVIVGIEGGSLTWL
ncbi:MAG: 4Fe-4S ferredoxin [Spirochaetae bacterium HGW-Spirochaetae-7]|jgi:ferredoxin|nr:MAG: 4Fe-4S ferredoxin [Spirochaetae bacterium HGW-Spirochaetae-7]